VSDGEEWITAVEAGERLGVTERQARRIIKGVSADDRTPVSERPAKVRWGAIRPAVCPPSVSDVRPEPVMSEEHVRSEGAGCRAGACPSPIAGDIATIGPKSMSKASGEGPDIGHDVRTHVRTDEAAIAALIGQLRDENAFLRSELSRAREGRDIAEADWKRLMALDRADIHALRKRQALLPAQDAETVRPRWWRRIAAILLRWRQPISEETE
jgi:hypothetical protein